MRVTDGGQSNSRVLAIRLLGASGSAQLLVPIDQSRLNSLALRQSRDGEWAGCDNVSYVAPPTSVSLLAAHNGVVIIDVVGSFGESAAETLVRDEQGDIVKRKTLPGAGGLISFPVDDEQVSRLTVSTRFSSLFESARVALTVPAGDTNPDAPSVKIVVPSTTAPRLEVEGLPGAQVIITDGVTTLASGFIRRGSLGACIATPGPATWTSRP